MVTHALSTRSPGGAFGLRAEEQRRWRRDGFFVRERVFRAPELARLRVALEAVARQVTTALDANDARYRIDGNAYAELPLGALSATVQLEHRQSSRAIRVIEPFHALHPDFEALVDDPRLVAPMRELVGAPQVALFTDKVNLKRPREGSGFDWHQDAPYWTHFCDHTGQLPNALLALDDAHTGNGCFRVIKGSHRQGCLPGRKGEGVLGPLFTHQDYFNLSNQVPIELAAGGVVFFSPYLVHGSQPNSSDAPRRALVLTYQPAGLRMFKHDRVRNAARLV